MIQFFKSIPFHLKSAGKSLVRHLVMTLSAASAVMVTLVLLAAFLMIAGNVSGFTNHIEDDIRIHAVLSEDIVKEEQLQEAKAEIEALDGVKEAELSSKENELKLWIAEKGEIFSIYEGENNPLHNAFFVSVSDPDRIAQINDAITSLPIVDAAMYGGNSISQLISMLNTVRSGIIVFVALLGILAIFLISNTIKMGIYARTNEISIMRNVGATNSFIKTPFMIEGMIIGLLGSILPCIGAYIGYAYLYHAMGGKLFSNVFALQPINPFVFQIIAVLIITGMLVGIIGSFLSTTKYLHWKR